MNQSQPKPLKRKYLLPFAILITGLALVLAAWAVDTPLPEWARKYPIVKPIASRYDPAKALQLAQAQRWQLDFDLVNEADMREINSRRFDVPNPYEKRARWFEEMAQGYELADLINQLFDFRKSSTINDEAVFTKLYALGKSGNEAAACMAEHFHRSLSREITARWKVSYDDVALAAAPYIHSAHPVCSELEWSLASQGKGGLEKDPQRAHRARIKPALAGFYFRQSGMSVIHIDLVRQMHPKAVEAHLCWSRVADRSSVHSNFQGECDSYRQGFSSDGAGHSIQVPPSIQILARQWCEPTRIVTPQECAQLESQLTSQGQ